MTTRKDQIEAAFKAFHLKNPAVFDTFVMLQRKVFDAGFKHYSAMAIVQQVRWHHAIEYRDRNLKINNNFAPHYSRLFHVTHPQFKGFFRERALVSATQPAQTPDIQDFAPIRENFELDLE